MLVVVWAVWLFFVGFFVGFAVDRLVVDLG